MRQRLAADVLMACAAGATRTLFERAPLHYQHGARTPTLLQRLCGAPPALESNVSHFISLWRSEATTLMHCVNLRGANYTSGCIPAAHKRVTSAMLNDVPDHSVTLQIQRTASHTLPCCFSLFMTNRLHWNPKLPCR
jgi:hypothetical protein